MIELTFDAVNEFIIEHLSRIIDISKDEKNNITRNVIIIIFCDMGIYFLSFLFCLIYNKSPEDEEIKGLNEYIEGKNQYTKKE